MACSRCGSDCTCACSGDPLPAHDWRRQVSLQVRAHNARKRRRLDPDAPLLDFDPEPAATEQEAEPARLRTSWWNQNAVADAADPDSIAEEAIPEVTTASAPIAIEHSPTPSAFVESIQYDPEPPVMESCEHAPLPPFPRINGRVRNLIEFPRTQHHHELAEPVSDQLRIFEADEELPPPLPNPLSAIEIAPEELVKVAAEDLELPLQTASMEQRVYASAVDGSIMIAAIAVFGVASQFFATSLPMTKPLIASAAICSVLLLGIYYYLSLSLSLSTPGMQAAGLQLRTFDGHAPSRMRLRCRAIATVLSFAALGMGFAWALIDEDRLCWHDRITHTYLAPKLTT
jgi:uncharacterized RDD family membrane protein YckC